ncbi:MAG TPA: phosphate ABC transporter permease PstA [Candidatus Dormibacteraeota bacterium]|jgi:phosphate transport system permease protein|nr:phosphate ABC transporter permease PstA [Candidatus Dormibacteraeota bacterium]
MASYAMRKLKDRLAYFLGVFCVAVALVPLASILVEVVRNGISAINLSFLTTIPSITIGSQSAGGIGPAIQGTLLLLLLTSLFAVPTGLMAGIYLAEFGDNRLGRTIRFLNDVFTEFPSIVVGILIYSLVVVATRSFSPYAGATALAVIMLPIVTRTTEESLKLVPNSLRDAAMALGIRKWRTTVSIVLTTGKGGIATGILLSIARISGETAPLLLTILGSQFFFSGWNSPIDALPLRIFKDASLPSALAQQQAWGAALVLIGIVLSLNITIRLATRGRYSARGTRR